MRSDGPINRHWVLVQPATHSVGRNHLDRHVTAMAAIRSPAGTALADDGPAEFQKRWPVGTRKRVVQVEYAAGTAIIADEAGVGNPAVAVVAGVDPRAAAAP